MEGFSMPPYTKRIARAACQALLLLCRPWDVIYSGPAPQPCQGRATPNTLPSDWHNLRQPCPQACTGCMISVPLDLAPKTWQASDPHTHNLVPLGHALWPARAFTISTTLDCAPKACQVDNLCWLHPQACTGLHDFCCASLRPLGLPSLRSTYMISTLLVTSGLHRLARFPPGLCP
jgi:hypothetical protein